MRTIGVRLVADVASYMANMNRASGGTKQFVSELDKAAKAGHLDAVADQSMRMGLAVGAAVALVVSAAAKFEQQMSRVAAVTDTTAAEMDALSKAAIRAGKDTSFSATEAAKAEEELAKAGISVTDILGGGLDGALALAAAGTLELEEAADVAAKTMNVFGLSGKDVAHIADVYAAAANKSATDVHELGEAIRMGGLAADAAGMKLEETTGTLAAFADRALIGSDAGTSLKTMLMMIQAPTDKSAKLMKELGINAYDAAGNFIGTTKLAGVLQKQLGGLTQEQRNAALAQIFGADAMRAANVLYELGEQGIVDYTTAVNDQGAAAETAREKTDNLVGDVERLTGSLESLAIESGSGANSGLRAIVQTLDELVSWFGELPPVISGGVVILGALAAASLLGMSAFIRLRGAAGKAIAELEAMGPAGERAAAGLHKVGRGATIAAAALVALQIAGSLADEFAEADVNTEDLTKSLEELGRTGKASGELTRVFGGDLSKLGDELYDVDGWFHKVGKTAEDWIPGLRSLSEATLDFSFTKSTQDVKALDDALTALVAKGDLETARAAFHRATANSGKSYEDLMRLLPGYAAAITEAEKSTTAAAKAEKVAAEKAELLAGGLTKAEAAGKGLIDVFDQLNGAALEWSEAEDNLQEAIAKAVDVMKEHGKAGKENSEAGRDEREALREIAEATRDATQARYNETNSLTDAIKVHEQGRAAFIANAVAAGYTKQAAADLADQWMKMPTLVGTTVTTPGLNQAIADVNALRFAIERLPDATVRANISVGAHRGYRWGGVVEHARWGKLREADMFSAVSSGARYAIAEPETKGEAFVPKSGNAKRSLGVLQHAAGWYGHTIVPTGGSVAGMGGGGGVQTIVHHHEHTHTVQLSSRDLMGGFRRQIELRGGNVQNATGSRSR